MFSDALPTIPDPWGEADPPHTFFGAHEVSPRRDITSIATRVTVRRFSRPEVYVLSQRAAGQIKRVQAR
jgi:hypothetical protein